MKSARSEKRSSVESQKAPNCDCLPVMCATLPSMKSKMLATIMITPARMNRSFASAQAATTLISTPISVRTLGWMPSATLSVDDRAQREHADRADRAGEGHRLHLESRVARPILRDSRGHRRSARSSMTVAP